MSLSGQENEDIHGFLQIKKEERLSPLKCNQERWSPIKIAKDLEDMIQDIKRNHIQKESSFALKKGGVIKINIYIKYK